MELKIDDALKSKWYLPQAETQSVTLLVHGLNFRADYMKDIIDLLVNSGSAVLNVSIPGYRETLDPKTGSPYVDIEQSFNANAGFGIGYRAIDKLAMHPEHNASLNDIYSHLMSAYCLAKDYSNQHKVPLNLSGFSMGRNTADWTYE